MAGSRAPPGISVAPPRSRVAPLGGGVSTASGVTHGGRVAPLGGGGVTPGGAPPGIEIVAPPGGGAAPPGGAVAPPRGAISPGGGGAPSSALPSLSSSALKGKALSSLADSSPPISSSPNSHSSSLDSSSWRVFTSPPFLASSNRPAGSHSAVQPHPPCIRPGGPRSFSPEGDSVLRPTGAQCSPLGAPSSRWAAPIVVP